VLKVLPVLRQTLVQLGQLDLLAELGPLDQLEFLVLRQTLVRLGHKELLDHKETKEFLAWPRTQEQQDPQVCKAVKA
jgi:hypothetical protein